MTGAADVPVESAPAGKPGLLIHAAGPLDEDALVAVLRTATNAVAALPSSRPIEVLVQGPGVRMLAAGSSVTAAVREALGTGMRLLACGNSLRSAGLEPPALTPGVGAVPAAIAHLAQRQWDGWAYARL
jgi:intracellular sulfur oxidation DsrE/DsrF family protein